MARNRAARPEAKPLRLFVALDIPEPAKDVVEEAFAPWRDEFPKARWVPRENMHVTVRFLGRTWPRLTDWVPERIEEAVAELEPFETRLVGVGSFPSAKRYTMIRSVPRSATSPNLLPGSVRNQCAYGLVCRCGCTPEP